MKKELLAPAGDTEAGYAALYYGADAVYLGLKHFSARATAANFGADDLNEFVGYAHSLGRKVYVAVNTLLQEDELPELLKALDLCAKYKVDALIVQDLGVARIVREAYPELELHASTQMAVHNKEGALALQKIGFSRVVLARELTLNEIREIAAIPGLETEAFIHGALCYSYSGLCMFSSLETGKSANRGKCLYPCRAAFGGCDGEKHYISMKDMALQGEVLRMPVTSLKIEGRKKTALYVAAAVDYYRRILSAAVKESLGKFSAIPTIDFDTEDMPDIPAFEQARPIEPPKVHYNTDFNPFKTSSASSYGGGGNYSRPKVEWEGLYSGLEKASRMNEPMEEEPFAEDTVTGTAPREEERGPYFQETVPSGASASFYGNEATVEKGAQHFQFKGRFILTSVKSGLMLIDQHRAHVRVLFDRYMSQIRQKQGVSQGVLFPEIIQLPASEAAVLDGILEDLSAVGFDLSPLGGGSYAINGIPSGIEGLNPVELVRNMVHTAMEKGNDVKEEVQTILASTLARAAAIVYGQVLSNEEMSNLVDNLFACPSPNYTPDGKTVLATIKEDDIEKLFSK